MAYELREGQGTLFKNKQRTGEQPHARGEAKIGGVIYEIAAWTKETKNGDKWQSLSIKPKGERQAPRRTEGAGGLADMDDDIPFISLLAGDDPMFRCLR